MADQGLLAQAKPAGTTNTVLYAAPIDASASAILNIANDGSASQWDLALKDYDQKLTLDASTYALHKGDIVSGYRVNLNTPVPAAATLAELGYNVKAFYFQDSPRRAHSIAAQGGINAAKNYQGDGDSIYRLFYDTIKG